MNNPHQEFPSTVNLPLSIAAEADGSEKNAAYGEIYNRYLQPLTNLISRKWGLPAEEARVLVHEFLVKTFFTAADRDHVRREFREQQKLKPGKRFRWFLANRANWHVKDHFKNKGVPGKQRDFPEDLAAIVDRRAADECDADTEYEDACALQIFGEALDALKREFAEKDRLGDLWRLLELRFLEPIRSGGSPPDLHELGKRLGDIPPSKVANLFVTAQRGLDRCLVRAIAHWHDLVGEDAVKHESGKSFPDQLNLMESSMDAIRRALARHAWHQQLKSAMGGMSGNFVALAAKSGVRSADLFDQAAALWSLHLESPLDANFEAWRALDSTGRDVVWPTLGAEKTMKLGELFISPAPSIDVLKAIRDFGKRAGAAQLRQIAKEKPRLNDEERSLVQSRQTLFEGLYLVPIAVARLRHNVKLTADDDAKFVRLFRVLLGKHWPDEHSRAVVRDWLARFAPPATG
jgi:hypothetical protein